MEQVFKWVRGDHTGLLSALADGIPQTRFMYRLTQLLSV